MKTHKERKVLPKNPPVLAEKDINQWSPSSFEKSYILVKVYVDNAYLD